MPSMAAIPNSATKPIAEETLNGVPVDPQREDAAHQRHRDHARGQQRVAQLPKFKYSSSTISAIDSGTATLSRATASCRLPNSPTHSRR